MLFSATQTKKTEDLARISLKKRPVYIDVEEFEQHSTVSGLQQVLISVKQIYGMLWWCVSMDCARCNNSLEDVYWTR